MSDNHSLLRLRGLWVVNMDTNEVIIEKRYLQNDRAHTNLSRNSIRLHHPISSFGGKLHGLESQNIVTAVLDDSSYKAMTLSPSEAVKRRDSDFEEYVKSEERPICDGHNLTRENIEMGYSLCDSGPYIPSKTTKGNSTLDDRYKSVKTHPLFRPFIAPTVCELVAVEESSVAVPMSSNVDTGIIDQGKSDRNSIGLSALPYSNLRQIQSDMEDVKPLKRKREVGPFVCMSATRGAALTLSLQSIFQCCGTMQCPTEGTNGDNILLRGDIVHSVSDAIESEPEAAIEARMAALFLDGLEEHQRYTPKENLMIIAAPVVDLTSFDMEENTCCSDFSDNEPPEAFKKQADTMRYIDHYDKETDLVRKALSPVVIETYTLLSRYFRSFLDNTLIIFIEPFAAAISGSHRGSLNNSKDFIEMVDKTSTTTSVPRIDCSDAIDDDARHNSNSIREQETQRAMCVSMAQKLITYFMSGWNVNCGRRVVSSLVWQRAIMSAIDIGLPLGCPIPVLPSHGVSLAKHRTESDVILVKSSAQKNSKVYCTSKEIANRVLLQKEKRSEISKSPAILHSSAHQGGFGAHQSYWLDPQALYRIHERSTIENNETCDEMLIDDTIRRESSLYYSSLQPTQERSSTKYRDPASSRTSFVAKISNIWRDDATITMQHHKLGMNLLEVLDTFLSKVSIGEEDEVYNGIADGSVLPKGADVDLLLQVAGEYQACLYVEETLSGCFMGYGNEARFTMTAKTKILVEGPPSCTFRPRHESDYVSFVRDEMDIFTDKNVSIGNFSKNHSGISSISRCGGFIPLQFCLLGGMKEKEISTAMCTCESLRSQQQKEIHQKNRTKEVSASRSSTESCHTQFPISQLPIKSSVLYCDETLVVRALNAGVSAPLTTPMNVDRLNQGSNSGSRTAVGGSEIRGGVRGKSMPKMYPTQSLKSSAVADCLGKFILSGAWSSAPFVPPSNVTGESQYCFPPLAFFSCGSRVFEVLFNRTQSAKVALPFTCTPDGGVFSPCSALNDRFSTIVNTSTPKSISTKRTSLYEPITVASFSRDIPLHDVRTSRLTTPTIFSGNYSLVPVLDQQQIQRLFFTEVDFGSGLSIDTSFQEVERRKKDEIIENREWSLNLMDVPGHVAYRLHLELKLDLNYDQSKQKMTTVPPLLSADIPKLEVRIKMVDNASALFFHGEAFMLEPRQECVEGPLSGGYGTALESSTLTTLNNGSELLWSLGDGFSKVRNGTTMHLRGVVVLDLSQRPGASMLPTFNLCRRSSEKARIHSDFNYNGIDRAIDYFQGCSEEEILRIVTVYSCANVCFTVLAERPILPGSVYPLHPFVVGKHLMDTSGLSSSSSGDQETEDTKQINQLLRVLSFSAASKTVAERQLSSPYRFGLPLRASRILKGDSERVWANSDFTRAFPVSCAVIYRSDEERGFLMWNFSGAVPI